MSKLALLFVTLLWVFSFGMEKEMSREAILLVAFGTTSEPGMKAYGTIEAEAKKQFPEIPIFWAYTSETVRKRVKKKTGKETFSVTEMLPKLQEMNYSKVTVQSLHVVAGEEFEQLTRQVRQFEIKNPAAFEPIKIGRPLLCSKADVDHVVSSVLTEFKEKRKEGEGLILLGHGHHHGVADLPYVAANYSLQDQDSLSFIANIEGGVTLDGVEEKFKAAKVKTVWLAPFMVVAGVHTVEDLIGEEESVKAEFEAAGFTCKAHVKGLGEYKSIAQLFVKHLELAQEAH